MPNEFQYDVFLSHSAKDKAVVWPLVASVCDRRSKGRRSQSAATAAKNEEGLEHSSCELQPLIEDGLEHCQSGLQHSAFSLQPFLRAFGSDWAQLEAGTSGRGNLPFRDPLNQERSFNELCR